MKKIISLIVFFATLTLNTVSVSANEIPQNEQNTELHAFNNSQVKHIAFENLANPQIPGLELFGTDSTNENIIYNKETNQLQISLSTYSRVNSQYDYPYPAVSVSANGKKVHTSYKYDGLKCIISFTPLKKETRYEFSTILYINIADPHSEPIYIGFMTSNVAFSF